MKNRFILLFTLTMSMTAYSMNLSWLGKLKPVVSRAASVACNYVKEHKVIAVGVGAVASAGAIAAAYKTWLFYKDVLLLRAAREGYLGAVRILLAAGANKEAVDRNGDTPLHLAAWNGNAGIVRTLVQAGANKDAFDRGVYTAVHLAAIRGNTEIVRILVQVGANKEAVDRNGDTPLHWAVIKGNTEIVRILVYAGANKEAVDPDGYTPLRQAVVEGKTEIVSILVQAGANKDAADRQGCTPLLLAVLGGNTEIVRILVQAGVNKEAAVNGNGCTALRRAVIGGNMEIVRTLVQAGANVESVGRAMRVLAPGENTEEIIDYLDRVPLLEQYMHAAARAGNVGEVRALIAQGAPVWPGIVAALREYNLQAPSMEHGEIARLLLEVMGMRQAARAKCADGRTLLHLAAACGNTKFAEALLRYGADVNAVDGRGNTPLHVAKSAEMNGILLQYKARTDVMNVDGKVPFSAQINQWMPWFRKWVEEDQKIPELFTATVQV